MPQPYHIGACREYRCVLLCNQVHLPHSVFPVRGSAKMAEFEHLFTPITIGNVRLKNRIYSSGHIPAYAEDG